MGNVLAFERRQALGTLPGDEEARAKVAIRRLFISQTSGEGFERPVPTSLMRTLCPGDLEIAFKLLLDESIPREALDDIPQIERVLSVIVALMTEEATRG